MGNPTNRVAFKRDIAHKIMSLEAEKLATAQAHYDAFLKDAQLDGREEHDKDDIVGARENMDLAAAFDHPVQTHHAKIEVLAGLDFSLKEAVEPGAVVRFNGRSFVVAVSTTRFDLGGKTFIGISQQSPIYQAMAGLRAGDSFAHNGQNFVIDDVI